MFENSTEEERKIGEKEEGKMYVQRWYENMREGRLKDTPENDRKYRKFNKLNDIGEKHGYFGIKFLRKHKRIMRSNVPQTMNRKHHIVKAIAYVVAFLLFASGFSGMMQSIAGLEKSFFWGFIKFVLAFVLGFGVKAWASKELYQYNYPTLMIKRHVDKSEMGMIEKIQVTIQEFFNNLFSKEEEKEEPKTELINSKEHIRFGKELANKMGLWRESYNDEHSAEAIEDKDGNIYFHTETPPAKLTLKEMLQSSDMIKDEYGVVTVRDGRNLPTDDEGYINFETKNEGVLRVPQNFTMLLMKQNPLKEGFAVDTIDEIEVENNGGGIKVYNAIDINNEIIPTTLNELAGVLIGGIPGSGKSAFLITLCSALIERDLIDLTIIDLKGTATDWNAFEGLAKVMQLETDYTTGESNLDEILETVTDFANGTEERMKEFTEKTGSTNFWHEPVTPQNKIRMIVLDECQEVFDDRGASNDDKYYMDKIKKQCTRIVKKHRSLGGIAVFATQRPSQNSVPLDIRQNCGLRVAFKLTEESAESLTLGERGAGVTVSALDIGSGLQGTAVLSNGDDGQRKMVRYAYIGGKDLNREMKKIKEQRPHAINEVKQPKKKLDTERLKKKIKVEVKE